MRATPGLRAEKTAAQCTQHSDWMSLSVPENARPSIPSRTPANLALCGSGHAHAINSYATCAACFTDLRDHAVRLLKRRGRHGLHGCCQGQGKSNSD